METIGVKAIEKAQDCNEIIVIDEIGKMELFSEKFKTSVLNALDSGKRIIGVIHRGDEPFLNAIRKRKDVIVFEIHLQNHTEVYQKVLQLLNVSV